MAVSCLTLAACGGSVAVESAKVNQSAGSVVLTDSIDHEGPQYGDTLDEWTGSVAGSEAAGNERALPKVAQPGYEIIEWDDLRVPGFAEDELYARYTERLDEISDDAEEVNRIYAEMQTELESAGAEVNAELDGSQIQLAGFVAPLSYEGDAITEFLLVPYFGACIHVPPPPPNQTILVALDEGMSLDDSFGAIWVTGTLAVSKAETDLATASYAITGATSIVYDA